MLASLKKRRLTNLLEWVNNWKIHGSASSLLCPFSYQGKVNILGNEWIRRRDLPIFRRSQGHNDKQGRMFFHSLHDPVFKSLSSAIKEAIFGKSLLGYLETIRQVAKIDHAQGQIQCSNTCTLFLCQNLFLTFLVGNGSSVSFFSALWSRTVLEICRFLQVLA